MKKILIGAIIIIFSFTITLPLFADDNKIDDKYDLVGTYQQNTTHVWKGTSAGATWNYKIHIKVAKDTTKSKGMVHFSTDGVEVVGHVEDVKIPYPYWPGNNIAVVGWANYNGQKYYFMLLYSASKVWFCLSETSYEARWSIGEVFLGLDRAYQTHSSPGPPLEFDYKDIH